MQKWWWLAAWAAQAAVVEPMKHDVIALNAKNMVDAFAQYRDRFPGAILFYHGHGAGKSAATKYVREVWDPLAKQVKGMARIAAIDCAEAAALCKEQLAADAALAADALAVRVYPPLPLPSYTVDKSLPLAQLKRAVLKHLRAGKFAAIASEAELKDFVGREANVPKVLLYSTKADAPKSVVWKALTQTFGDRMSFAVLSDAALAQKLNLVGRGATSSKLAIKLRDTSLSARGVELFSGSLTDFAALVEWLNVRSETFVRGGGVDLNVKTSSAAKPWLEAKYPELSKGSHKDLCFGVKDKLCGVFALAAQDLPTEPGVLPAPFATMFDTLRAQVKKPALALSWVDLEKETALREALALPPGQSAFVVINPHKRLRFTALASPKQLADVLHFIEQLKAGDARFTLLKNGVPSFVSRLKPKLDEL